MSNNLTTPSCRHALPKNRDDIELARRSAIPKKTMDDTEYCIRLWREWSLQRNIVISSEQIPTFFLGSSPASQNELAHALECFVLEVRKKNGAEYSPNSLHHIVCGIMRYVRATEPSIDFFKDSLFANFRKTLDGEMKRIQQKGIGTHKRQAEVLTEDEEELLWQKGLLGDHSPIALLNTVFFMSGLFLALRSGSEHRQLRLDPPQITIHEDCEIPYILYEEDVFKNHQGGLKNRKTKQKTVKHHANEENPARCFIRIFKLYLTKLNPNAPRSAFYFKPLQKWSNTGVWFTNKPLGHNTLENMMATICKKANVTGYKTNHSLRATVASRLYHSGLDEQLIMERTGHRSIEGIRSYKRTSNQQQVTVSNVLNSAGLMVDYTTTAQCSSSSSEHSSAHEPGRPDSYSGIQLHNCTNVTICVNNNYGNKTVV